jgi:hypothetical protein
MQRHTIPGSCVFVTARAKLGFEYLAVFYIANTNDRIGFPPGAPAGLTL